MKKLLTIGLLVLLATSIVFASGQQGAATGGVQINKTGMPIVNQKITYKLVSPQIGDTSYNEKEFYKELEKTTNIHMEWEEVNPSVWTEKIQLIMSSKDLPDAVYGLIYDSNLVQQMGTEKLIIPLQNLVKEWAPNFQKVFDNNPAFKKANTFLDGNMYSLFAINEATYQKDDQRLYINQEWLTALKLPMPKTTQEFYTTMKAFKDNNMGGPKTVCWTGFFGNWSGVRAA